MRSVVIGLMAMVFMSSAHAEQISQELDKQREQAEQDYLYSVIANAAIVREIDPVVLESVITQESGDPQNAFRLNPYALNIKGLSVYPVNKIEAYRRIVKELAKGTDSVGVGLGQVEWRYHSSSFNSLWDALDIHKNIAVAADYLAEMYKRCKGDTTCAVATYHNRNKEIGLKYARYVAMRCVARYPQSECEVFDGAL